MHDSLDWSNFEVKTKAAFSWFDFPDVDCVIVHACNNGYFISKLQTLDKTSH